MGTHEGTGGMIDDEFYFNVTTGEVERGKVSPQHRRLGPYRTREEAAAALERAQGRNEAWDEADERWRDDWKDDDDWDDDDA